MRRLPILLAFGLLFVVFVVAAATAATSPKFCDVDKYGLNHPNCPTPPPPTTTPIPPPPPPPDDPFPDCDFVSGVLQDWDGSELLRCIWHADPAQTFAFQIDSQDVTYVKLPHMIVNDIVNEEIVYDAKCFDETRSGIQTLPFPGDDDDLWTFSPADAGCGDGPYLLTVAAPVHKVKSGTLELRDYKN